MGVVKQQNICKVLSCGILHSVVLWDTLACPSQQVRSLQASGPGINTTPDHNSGPFDPVRQQLELAENTENHGAGSFTLKGESFVVYLPPPSPASPFIIVTG